MDARRFERQLRAAVTETWLQALRRWWRARRPRLRIRIADAINRLRHGRGAPLKYQTLWVRPAAITRRLDAARLAAAGFRRGIGRGLRSRASVLPAGDWDRCTAPLLPSRLAEAIASRCDGHASWEATGAPQRLLERIRRRGAPIDGCATDADVQARFSALDALIEACRHGAGIVPRRRVDPGAFREEGGIAVAVDRHGEVVFAGAGHHRLFVARHLGLPRVPVCVCAVHPHSVRSGAWARLLAESRALEAAPAPQPQAAPRCASPS